jgi:hypothetical protein
VNENEPVKLEVTQEQWDALQERVNSGELEKGTLAEQYRALFLAVMPDDRRSAAEALFAEVDRRSSSTSDEAALEEKARNVYARELALENQQYGVKADDLIAKAKTTAEMDMLVVQAKAAHYEALANGKTNSDGKLSNLPSDRGGNGQGGSPAPKIEGKGMKVVQSHFADLISARRGNGQ